jgi:nickel/cobalt exporter
MRRVAGLLVLATALVLAMPSPAGAHPLGNFTINRFSGLELSTDRVTVHYVVDMAEIPSFQELSRLTGDDRERPSAMELRDYAAAAASRLRGGLFLSADGRRLRLHTDGWRAHLRPGQGGLATLRIEAEFSSALNDDRASISFRDDNYSGRIGWREIIAYGIDGQGIASSTVPRTSISKELTSYPTDMLQSPLNRRAAQVRLQPGTRGSARGAIEGSRVASPSALGGSIGSAFASLVDHDLSPAFLLAALALALTAGGLHALGPGHGKSIMAAYLVGTEARVRNAVQVGTAVSLMHTASVVAVGIAILAASRVFAPEQVFPWLSLLSGGVVLLLGAWLLTSRLRSERRHRRAHAHSHSHDHAHDFHHAIAPSSWRGLGVIALSGGLLPSPSALVVLLGAVALHRVVFGLVLVGAFSVGLASALTGVGILVIKARSAAKQRLGERLTRLFPVASAMAITAIGFFLTAGAAAKL